MISFIQRNIKNVLIRNIPTELREYEVLYHLSKAGPIKSIHFPVDEAEKNKGYALVEYSDPDSEPVAFELFNEKKIGNKFLKVILFKENSSNDLITAKPLEDRTEYLQSKLEIINLNDLE
jgi:RNA recognition motif-containing protein